MAYLIVIGMVALVVFLSYHAGKFTSMAMDKVSPRDLGYKPTHLAGKIFGVFLGVMAWAMIAFFTDDFASLWAIVLGPLAYPALAAIIFIWVRASENITSQR